MECKGAEYGWFVHRIVSFYIRKWDPVPHTPVFVLLLCLQISFLLRTFLSIYNFVVPFIIPNFSDIVSLEDFLLQPFIGMPPATLAS